MRLVRAISVVVTGTLVVAFLAGLVVLPFFSSESMANKIAASSGTLAAILALVPVVLTLAGLQKARRSFDAQSRQQQKLRDRMLAIDLALDEVDTRVATLTKNSDLAAEAATKLAAEISEVRRNLKDSVDGLGAREWRKEIGSEEIARREQLLLLLVFVLIPVGIISLSIAASGWLGGW